MNASAEANAQYSSLSRVLIFFVVVILPLDWIKKDLRRMQLMHSCNADQDIDLLIVLKFICRYLVRCSQL